MHLTKTSVTIPDDLLVEAKKVSTNLSALVAEALREYLRQRKVEKALQSFGSWEDRPESSCDIVNELREEGDRRHAERSR